MIIAVDLARKATKQTIMQENLGKRPLSKGPREHSAILSTFIKLPFVIKVFVLSVFEWPFYTGFTVIV